MKERHLKHINTSMKHKIILFDDMIDIDIRNQRRSILRPIKWFYNVILTKKEKIAIIILQRLLVLAIALGLIDISFTGIKWLSVGLAFILDILF